VHASYTLLLTQILEPCRSISTITQDASKKTTEQASPRHDISYFPCIVVLSIQEQLIGAISYKNEHIKKVFYGPCPEY
jgi:hypothetical protein